MAQMITIKQGASLQFGIAFTQAGAPVDLTGSTVSSQVRDAQGDLVADLTITMNLAAGTGTVSVIDTSTWPRGMHRCDIKVASATQITFSQTFSIQVIQGVTQP